MDDVGFDWTREALLDQDRLLRRIAGRLVRDHDAADDVVQETWVAALEGRRQEISNPLGWLIGTTRIQALARWRRERKRSVREAAAAEDEIAQVSAAAGPTDELQVADVRRILADAVHGLDDPYREVVVLRYYEELDPPAIGRRLDRPLNTVKSQLRRGLQRLRERMDAESGGGRSLWGAALISAFDLREPEVRAVATTSAGSGATLLASWSLVAALSALGLIALVWFVRPDRAGDEVAAAALDEPAFDRSAPDPTDLVLDVPLHAEAPARDSASVEEPVAESAATAGAPEPEPVGARLDPIDLSVVDESGHPVAAKVYLQAHDGVLYLQGRTDADGKLVLRPAASFVGAYDYQDTQDRLCIEVDAEGRAPSEVHLVPSASDLRRATLRAGPPATRLRGRVLDVEGLPIAGATVRVFWGTRRPHTGPDGTVILGRSLEVETDERGQYEHEAVASVPRSIEVLAEGFLTWIGRETLAQPLQQRDFVLERGATLEGVVRLPGGEPAAGARVWAFNHSYGTVETDADDQGRYRLERVSTGLGRIWAEAAEEPDLVVLQRVDVKSGESRSLDLALRRAHGVRLRLEDEDGAPLEGFNVIFACTDGGLYWTREVLSDAEGRAAVYAHPDRPLEARIYDTWLSTFPVEVRPDLAPHPEERTVVLPRERDEPARLHGLALQSDGRPFESSVEVRLVSARTGLDHAVTPTGGGAFAVEGLPADTYGVYVSTTDRGMGTLAEATVAAGQDLDLGALRAPELGELHVDWSWESIGAGGAMSFMANQARTDDGRTFYTQIDGGPHAPKATYRVFPGIYLFQAGRANRSEQQRVVQVRPDHPARIQMGPEAGFVLDVLLTEAVEAEPAEWVDVFVRDAAYGKEVGRRLVEREGGDLPVVTFHLPAGTYHVAAEAEGGPRAEGVSRLSHTRIQAPVELPLR